MPNRVKNMVDMLFRYFLVNNHLTSCFTFSSFGVTTSLMFDIFDYVSEPKIRNNYVFFSFHLLRNMCQFTFFSLL